ncbi:hypothetical protein RCL1_000328 [Eukaryota sp. TZLM3-RCL]
MLYICFALLLFALCQGLEFIVLPGLEDFTIPVQSSNHLPGSIDINYEVPGVKLRVKGRLSSNVLKFASRSALTSSPEVVDGTIVTVAGEVFRARDCFSGRCQFEKSSPLDAYTSLSFKYETTRTRNFDFSWNYDKVSKSSKEVIKVNDQISLPDTYFYAGSALSIDFAFNILEGIQKCEARLVSEVDLSVSVLLTNPNFSFDQRIASISFGTFYIPLLIPIPVSPRLVIDFVGSVNAPGNYGATFKAKNELIEQTAGYLKGLYFTNDFGSWQTQFNQDVTTADISVMFGIRATIDVRVASAVSVNVSITPTIDGVVSFGRCPGTAFLDLDFLLHRSYGLSDIGFTVFGRYFGFKTDKVITVESPTRHKIISRCLNSQSLDVVAQSIQQENTPAYWVRVEVRDGTLSNLYLVVNNRRTAFCVISGSRCTFADAFHVRSGEFFSFRLRHSGTFWDTTRHDGNVLITDGNPRTIWSSSGNHRIILTPIVASEIEMNKLISVDWTESTNAQTFFELHESTTDASVYRDKRMYSNGNGRNMAVYAATNAASTGTLKEILSWSSPQRGYTTPSSRHHFLDIECSSTPEYHLRVELSNAFSQTFTLDRTEIAKTPWNYDFYIQSTSSKTLEVDYYHYRSILPNIYLYTLTHDVFTPGTASRWRTPCLLTSRSFYPSVFMSIDRPLSATGSLLLLYTDMIVSSSGCRSFTDGLFYHFEPAGISSISVFYQVTGKWSNYMSDTHISEIALLLTDTGLLISRATQTSCLFKYFIFKPTNQFDLAPNEKYVVLIEAPAYTVTTMDCPSGMKWTSLLLEREFDDLDQLLPTPDKESSVFFNNVADSPIEYVVIYSCETSKCTGTVPVPRYSRRMVTGIPFYSSSKGNTEFQSTTECLRGEISYDIDAAVTVRIDVPHAGELYPITDIGSFTINHRFSEFIMRSSYDGEAFHWGTFTFNCINGPSSTIFLPPLATASFEFSPPLLSTPTSVSSSSWKGFVKLKNPHNSAMIVGSIYSGKDTLLFINGDIGDIQITSYDTSTSFSATLEYVPYQRSELVCEGTESMLDCSINGMDQFTTEIADVGLMKNHIQLVSSNGPIWSVTLTAVEVISPRRAFFNFSSTLESGTLGIHHWAATLSADSYTAEFTIPDPDPEPPTPDPEPPTPDPEPPTPDPEPPTPDPEPPTPDPEPPTPPQNKDFVLDPFLILGLVLAIVLSFLVWFFCRKTETKQDKETELQEVSICPLQTISEEHCVDIIIPDEELAIVEPCQFVEVESTETTSELENVLLNEEIQDNNLED